MRLVLLDFDVEPAAAGETSSLIDFGLIGPARNLRAITAAGRARV